MEYSIQELSKLAGVTTRTLRYYDEIGLLKPSRLNQAGYRYYGEYQVALLQQILFYRERGLDMKTIHKIVSEENFDMLSALQEHLQILQQRQKETDALIQTVQKTIRYMKGACTMSDKERFEGLKENEAKYGKEARQKYGEASVMAANEKLSHLTQEQYALWRSLEQQILDSLEDAVKAGVDAQSQQAKEITQLHKKWLMLAVPGYCAAMHRGIAAMYVADPRFTAYYDGKTPGCAQLLYDAVLHWIQ